MLQIYFSHVGINIYIYIYIKLTESNDGRNVSEFGVTDSLRDGEAGDGKACNQVESKETPTVFRKPFEDRNEVFNGFLKTAERLFFVTKAAKGVVGKEGLFEIRTESGGESSWLGKVDGRYRVVRF